MYPLASMSLIISAMILKTTARAQRELQLPRRKTTADKTSHDAVAGLNRLGQSLNKMSRSSERSAKITADFSNMQNLCSTIESLESSHATCALKAG